jgi:hypothetical protein
VFVLICGWGVGCGSESGSEPGEDAQSTDTATLDTSEPDEDAPLRVDVVEDAPLNAEDAADSTPSDGGEDASTEDADTAADAADDRDARDSSEDTEPTDASDAGEDDAGEDDAGEDDAGEDDAGEDDTGEDDAGEDDAGEDDADAMTDVAPPCDDHLCEPGARCVDGVCSAACDEELPCSEGFACVAGACVVIPTCSCADADGDGFYSVECEDALCVPRTDCDDTTDTISPAVAEICGNGLDDDCVGGDEACPSVCASGNGLYCGTNGVPGDPSTLYVCVDGRVDFRAVCVEGCQFNDPGFNDACNPGRCPFGSGLYCGPIVGLPDNVLLNCVDGAYIFAEACANRCVVADPGFNDFCE